MTEREEDYGSPVTSQLRVPPSTVVSSAVSSGIFRVPGLCKAHGHGGGWHSWGGGRARSLAASQATSELRVRALAPRGSLPHGGETEARRGPMTCCRSHSWLDGVEADGSRLQAPPPPRVHSSLPASPAPGPERSEGFTASDSEAERAGRGVIKSLSGCSGQGQALWPIGSWLGQHVSCQITPFLEAVHSEACTPLRRVPLPPPPPAPRALLRRPCPHMPLPSRRVHALATVGHVHSKSSQTGKPSRLELPSRVAFCLTSYLCQVT